MKSGISVTLHIDGELGALPGEEDIENWVHAALQSGPKESITNEVCIRLTSEEESQRLNLEYRDKNHPTNVLSFPLQAPLEGGGVLLGDVVICAPVVRAEALAQKKSGKAHWAHMVVHGVLHLQGYDHSDESGAEEMETLEKQILAELGFPDPYETCI